MLRIQFLWVGAALLTAATSASSAVAQIGADRIQRPINTPTFSPYLNMFRGRNDGGLVLNYYGLVRPQMQALDQNELMGQNLQSLQMQQMQMQQGHMHQGAMATGYGYSQLGVTGHPVTFQSFNNTAAGTGIQPRIPGSQPAGIGVPGMAAGGVGGMSGMNAAGMGMRGMGTGAGMMLPGMGTGRMSGHSAAFGTFNQTGPGR